MRDPLRVKVRAAPCPAQRTVAVVPRGGARVGTGRSAKRILPLGSDPQGSASGVRCAYWARLGQVEQGATLGCSRGPGP